MENFIWSPPKGREVDPANPFDVLYSAQYDISRAEEYEEKIWLAKDTIMRLLSASAALEGREMVVSSTSLLVPGEESDLRLFSLNRPCTVAGKYSSISFLNLSGYGRENELGIELNLSQSSKVPTYTYPLISQIESIFY